MGEPRESATPTATDEASRRRFRFLAAYLITGLFGGIALVAIVVSLSSGPASLNRGDPHINTDTGSTNGVPPDNRLGIEPSAFVAMNLVDAARTAGCDLRLHLTDEGHGHLAASARPPRYQTNPPTSGNHSEEQQADGAYLGTPPPASLVHSLEHGRLAIQYRPSLRERAQLELRGLFDAMYGGALLYPDPTMSYAIAATTWTNLLGCRRYREYATLLAITAFGQATWGRYGGEPVGTFPPTVPTPAEPGAP